MSAATIFALSSGRPPAAISVIRVSGPQAHQAGEMLAGPLPSERTAGVRELRNPVTTELLDEALVLRFDGPASATGEDIVEFQCHGGRAVVDSILGALDGVKGLRAARPGEFTRRAFENGRIDLTEAEGLADLIEAETESQRKAALALAEGGLRRQIDQWRERLLGFSAMAEQIIDYDEEDGDRIDPFLAKGCRDLARELQDWLDRPRAEALKDGVRVVVAGPPNAGKSSLINAIAGSERAIVTDVPGTTRDHIEVPLSLEGAPIVLTDTAGLRETADKVEAIGVARAGRLIECADVLIWLGELRDAPPHPRRICIHAQADRPDRRRVRAGALAVSAVSGKGIATLMKCVSDLAKDVLPAEDAIALNRRQAALLQEANSAIRAAAELNDAVLVAESLREARLAFDRLTGAAGVEDMLDALFGRFCLGK